MHESLDGVGAIHMNGRAYDPMLGRFISADPIVSVPGDLQAYNRYSYVGNRPIMVSDPRGTRGTGKTRSTCLVNLCMRR
jgi:RHS repeat-associated protein